MADLESVKRVLRAWALATICLALVAVVSCNDPTEVSVFAPVDTVVHFDTTVVHDTVIKIQHDTTFIIVTDTLFLPADRIYCWLVDENKHHDDPPQFACDDGYMGPRI